MLNFGDMECFSIQINKDVQCEAEESFLLQFNILSSSSSRNIEGFHRNTYMIITDSLPRMLKLLITLNFTI